MRPDEWRGNSARRGKRAAACAALVALCATVASAQVADTLRADTSRAAVQVLADTAGGQVLIVSGERTPAGRALAGVLSTRHVVMDGNGRAVHLPRGTTFTSSLVVISPRVTVATRVVGSVVVVGGDLFLQPGARIDGDAIAIGGGVYVSTLARLAGERLSFRDETFDVVREGARFSLAHRVTRIESAAPVVTWPFRIGVRLPSYNRVDGLVVPWGPAISLGGGRFTADPVVTYRSHIGVIDPSLRATASLGAITLSANAQRGTFSNDRWIRSESLNSITTIWAGRDTRNYYRADRGDFRLGTRFAPGNFTVDPYVGVVNELAWSTGGGLSRDSHPWSLLGKDSLNGIFRPNPPVFRGRIESAIGGARLRWASGDVTARFSADVERAWEAPVLVEGVPAPVAAQGAEVFITRRGGRFTQAMFHGSISFPTFGAQRFESRAHAITSSEGADSPPPQRYAYLGGTGTIRTMDLLEQGGTELFFLEMNYIIPIQAIQLPLVGSPTFTLRYLTGAAGVDSLPDFTQNVGIRVGTRYVGVEYLIDPDSKEKRFGIGFSLGF